ncbi:MAG: arsenite S-adenosylmethyltransferase [candidate division Zixibacteria bacterium RBG-1]|nr:MAG: arsenite S-adenosylmethyltransferase [candidate division Zixibacteria bacterium RBG-1]OGC85370.1 MAG: arsenite S-adenosylmethyltransferase [candidate division Zixibacteria bacterium RBG_19FT_COMBO_42_43]
MANNRNHIIYQAVRQHYGEVAKRGASASCCAKTSSGCGDQTVSTVSEGLGYSAEEVTAVPEGANLGLGSGNPVAVAKLRSGEIVLDLGSGAGFDCFLAAKQVGESGHVIGVDMTPEMVNRARENATKGGYRNAEFRLGEIENLPLADASVDVIISNCVINLSPEKPKVFKEAFRVLKPGGRLAISDLVASTQIPPEIRENLALYCGCLAGAVSIEELEKMVEKAGFQNLRVKPKDQSLKFEQEKVQGRNIEDYVMSATIEAIKPK